jgi:hypothetical protein
LPRIVRENPARLPNNRSIFIAQVRPGIALSAFFYRQLRAFGDTARAEASPTMPNDNLARLEQFASDSQPSPNAAEPLGRVVSVGGSQVMVEFSSVRSSASGTGAR